MTDVTETTADEAKPQKLEKANQKFYLGTAACRKGKIYDALRAFVFANPGMTRAELIASADLKVAMGGTRNPDARKQAIVNDAYVNGYLSGGLRRNFLTDKADEAATEITFIETGKAVSDKVGAGELTKSGREFLNMVAGILTEAGVAADHPVSAETLEKKLGRPLALSARTISKLEVDGYLDVERAKDDKGETTKKILSVSVLKSAPVDGE